MEFNINYELLKTEEDFRTKFEAMLQWCEENDAHAEPTKNGYIIVENDFLKVGFELVKDCFNYERKYKDMVAWCKQNNAHFIPTVKGFVIVETEAPRIGLEISKRASNFCTQMNNMLQWCKDNKASFISTRDSYIIVERDINEVKEAKLFELKEARDKAEEAPIEYNGNMFDFDEKARERISMARDVLANGGTLMWTTADDNSVEVNAEDLGAIVLAAAVRSNTLHTKYRTLKEAVLNATTVEEVEALSFE